MYSEIQSGPGPEIDFELDDLQGLFKPMEVPRRQIAALPVTRVRPINLIEPGLAPSFEADLLSSLRLGNAPRYAILGRMIRTTIPFIVGDLLALALAGMFAQFVLHLFPSGGFDLSRWAFSVALFPLVIGFWLSGLYSEIWVHPVIELRQLSHLTTISLLAAAGGGVFTRMLPLWCAAAWPAAIVLVPFGRALVRKFCARREWWGYPTLVIDSAGPSGVLAHSLLRSPKSGLRPVMMTDPLGHCRSSILPVMNDAETLRSLVRTEGIRHAVVSLPDLSTADITSALDRYSDVIPHMLVLSDASTLPALWSASRGLGRLSGIEVRNGLLLATLQRVKRVLDLAVCLAVLILGLPLFAAIVAAIKTTDPGPVFFGHTRIGQHGRRFKTWKFRTMKLNAGELLREHLARDPKARAEWNEAQKLRDDPRVTRLGALLRKTSLDELPQVWNVLCGEMSLVGPRPIVDDEIRHYGKTMRLYAMVKPGITGLWQSSGRNEVGYRDRVLLDEFYVRHWSPWLDIFVLAKTINALIRRNGAY